MARILALALQLSSAALYLYTILLCLQRSWAFSSITFCSPSSDSQCLLDVFNHYGDW